MLVWSGRLIFIDFIYLDSTEIHFLCEFPSKWALHGACKLCAWGTCRWNRAPDVDNRRMHLLSFKPQAPDLTSGLERSSVILARSLPVALRAGNQNPRRPYASNLGFALGGADPEEPPFHTHGFTPLLRCPIISPHVHLIGNT